MLFIYLLHLKMWPPFHLIALDLLQRLALECQKWSGLEDAGSGCVGAKV